jgi:NAD(P)-dependent dehydrogenase (short-subunit alcohol dehydrogenase family)
MVSTSTVLARGNVAVITGGASGIGLAVADQLAARGMKLVLADIDELKLRSAESRLTEAGVDVAGVVCNTASEAAVTELAEATLERFGAAHLLFNNAGVAGVGDAWDGPIELWDRVIGINLYGVIHGVRSFLPIMTEQGVGHIVNTASMAGLVGMPGAAPYNATKHGVVAISESLFLELGINESPVGVSVLCPGFVKTDLMEKETTEVASPVAELIGAALVSGVETGIPASDVADQVIAAVDDGRFWILTHDDMKRYPVDRMERAAQGINPSLLGDD